MSHNVPAVCDVWGGHIRAAQQSRPPQMCPLAVRRVTLYAPIVPGRRPSPARRTAKKGFAPAKPGPSRFSGEA
jgi:hypothetical protein